MISRPKGKLFALLAVFVAIGLVTATGAFTSVQADRTVSITTAGDATANLQLTDAGNGYVDVTGDTITVDFGSSGANINADTDFGAVLTITNNGPNQVYVQIATATAQTSYTVNNLFEDDHTLDPQFMDASGNNIEGGEDTTGGNQLTLASGASANVHVTLTVPSGTAINTFSGSVIIIADTTDLTV